LDALIPVALINGLIQATHANLAMLHANNAQPLVQPTVLFAQTVKPLSVVNAVAPLPLKS